MSFIYRCLVNLGKANRGCNFTFFKLAPLFPHIFVHNNELCLSCIYHS
jgi:hypothetical protein